MYSREYTVQYVFLVGVSTYVPVSRRDAEAEDVADLGVDGVVGLGGAGDDGLDAAADEAGDLRAVVGAGWCLRDLSISARFKHAFRAVH
jgi:hypothetical protein